MSVTECKEISEAAMRSGLISIAPIRPKRKLEVPVHSGDYGLDPEGRRAYSRAYRAALRKLHGFEPRPRVIAVRRQDYPAGPAGKAAYNQAYQAAYRAHQKALQ